MFGVGFGGHESSQALEAVEFAGCCVAGFEKAVGVEGEAVVDVEVDGGLFVAGRGDQAKGKRRCEVELTLVEEGRKVAGVGEGAGAVGVDAEDEAGGEALLHAAVEAAVEAGEDVGWALEDVGEAADGADDECDGHRGFEAFAADVAEDKEGGAFGPRG